MYSPRDHARGARDRRGLHGCHGVRGLRRSRDPHRGDRQRPQNAASSAPPILQKEDEAKTATKSVGYGCQSDASRAVMLAKVIFVRDACQSNASRGNSQRPEGLGI